MNKNVKEAKRKFEIVLIAINIFQILGFLLMYTFINNISSGTNLTDLEFISFFKKTIIIFSITFGIIFNIIFLKKYIYGLSSLINTEPIRCVIEDFIIYPFGKKPRNRSRKKYRISPLVRSLEDNKLYFTYGNYSLSYYTSTEARVNNKVLSKTIYRGDGSEVKIGDTAYIYIKREVDVNVDIDKNNNIVKLDKLRMNFLHDNENYDINVFNKIVFFEGITEIEDIRDII